MRYLNRDENNKSEGSKYSGPLITTFNAPTEDL